MKRIFTLLFALTGIYANAQSPGNTLHFDGTDYVSCPLPSLFTGISTNSFTVETWVKPTGSSTMRVFSAQQSPTVFTSILLNASNSPYIYIYTGSAVYGYEAGTSLPSGQWSHLAVTWDASLSQTMMYINGVLQTLTSGGGSSTGTSGIMTIGSRSDGTQNLIGSLDEFRIWMK